MRIALWWALASIHLLAGAAWFGAMVYSLVMLHPKARRFFADDDDSFEAFIATTAQGARWKVIGGLALIFASGALMIPLAEPTAVNRAWVVIIAIKIGLLLLALGIFYVISWRWWPARIFADPKERPAIRRRFRAAAVTLITIAALASMLGVLARLQ